MDHNPRTVVASVPVPGRRFVNRAGGLGGADVIGVSENDAVPGKPCSVITLGNAVVEAAVYLAAGAVVDTDADGRAVLASGIGLGVAERAAVAGGRVDVRLHGLPGVALQRVVSASFNHLTGTIDFGLPVTHAQGAINTSQTGAAGTDLLIASCLIPGGSLGPNGELRCDFWLYSPASNANAKTVTIKYGGAIIASNANALTSARTARFDVGAYGNNSEGEILCLQTTGMNIAVQPAATGSNQHPATAEVDTTQNQLLEVFVNLAVSSDEVFLRRWHVETTWGR